MEPKPPKLPKDVLTALKMVSDAFYTLADEAGDVPIWNKGGEAHRASAAVKKVLKKYKPEEQGP